MTQTTTVFEAYRRMLTIRIAEEMIAKDFIENKIFSFYHSSAGQEASAVGVCLPLSADDRVFGNHRSHGHYLAKGGNLYQMFCEIYGKADGCCAGKGGSMHMLDRSAGFMGSTPILGSAVPIATGSAFEQKVNGKRGQVTVVFFGDGASEEGVVYESINIAAVMQLPIIYVIENNLYAVNTPQNVRRAKAFNRKDLYTGLGAEYIDGDGTDFVRTYNAMQIAIKSASLGIPVVLHLEVFRHMAHSGPIMDESVREKDTAAVRAAEDPITKIERYIMANSPATARELNDIAKAVRFHIAGTWEQAKYSADPDPATAYEGAYCV